MFHEGVGYLVNHAVGRVSLLNLKEYKWIDHIKNPTNDPVYFSKTHLYLGASRSRTLLTQRPKGPLGNMIFFDESYEGITGGIGGSHEEAFASMMAAIEHEDYVLARIKFNEAMAYGSAKAYAIGAVAFKLGIWGASQSEKRYFEFLVAADVGYLWELYNLYS